MAVVPVHVEQSFFAAGDLGEGDGEKARVTNGGRCGPPRIDTPLPSG